MNRVKFVQRTAKLISYDSDNFDHVGSTSDCIVSLLEYPEHVQRIISQELETFLSSIWPDADYDREKDAERIAQWFETKGVGWAEVCKHLGCRRVTTNHQGYCSLHVGQVIDDGSEPEDITKFSFDELCANYRRLRAKVKELKLETPVYVITLAPEYYKVVKELADREHITMDQAYWKWLELDNLVRGEK